MPKTKFGTTVMPREVKCLGCGYVQKDYVSYYRHKKTWDSVHTLTYCRSRKSHPAVQGNPDENRVVIVYGEQKLSVVRDSVDL